MSKVQPPAPPAPTPFLIFARSANADDPDVHLIVDGSPALVKGTSMGLDEPANEPSRAGGGDVMNFAVSAKGNVVDGSGTTTCGGKDVARTGDMVALNAASHSTVSQGQGPFIEGVDIAMGGGELSAEAMAAASKGWPMPANAADTPTAGNAGTNPSPCVDGHPVAIESGFVVDDDVDVSLPGVIPLVIERLYSSQRQRETGLLGRGGWVLSVEQWVAPRGDVLGVRLGDGRDAYFAPIGPGESCFHRREQLELYAEAGQHGPRYRLWDVRRRQWRRFEAQAKGGKARLTSITDAHGNAITFEYGAGERLTRIVDTARREVRCVYDEAGAYLRRLEVWSSVPAPAG
ncbi:MAG: DUF4150 domain-containing protein, partial [Myxococcales bacterium]|nr:DUF4150 domain-containing protein [Myxococcales bacterium]